MVKGQNENLFGDDNDRRPSVRPKSRYLPKLVKPIPHWIEEEGPDPPLFRAIVDQVHETLAQGMANLSGPYLAR